jgi:hypothetical protein
MKAQDWVEEYTQTMLGKLVKVLENQQLARDASLCLSGECQLGLVLKIDPVRYGGARHARQRPGALVLWSNEDQIWEPCVCLSPVDDQ